MPSRTSHVRFRPCAVVLQDVDDAEALLVVVEAARHQRVDDALAGVAERRVAEVVAERDRFRQLLVQPQHFRDRARDLRDLERVRETRAVVVAGRREEHLRLVLQPAERLAVDDAVAVALERGPDVVFGRWTKASARVGAFRRLRRQDVALTRFELFTKTCHTVERRGRRKRRGSYPEDRTLRTLRALRSYFVISRRKLVPWAMRPTPKSSASVWPRSANVFRVPRSTPARTRAPVTSSGTYSRA